MTDDEIRSLKRRHIYCVGHKADRDQEFPTALLWYDGSLWWLGLVNNKNHWQSVILTYDDLEYFVLYGPNVSHLPTRPCGGCDGIVYASSDDYLCLTCRT
jgi:hypothetical protein